MALEKHPKKNFVGRIRKNSETWLCAGSVKNSIADQNSMP